MAIVSDRYPYIELELVVRERAERIYFYIDTGFDGYVIAPAAESDHYGQYDYISRWTLGDGSIVEGMDYLGKVRVIDVTGMETVRVTCLGTEFIVGRKIIDKLKVTFHFGQKVVVEQ
ncbi:MAG TPA: hypothetical protein VII11_02800 [Bacteroidota bacterium]